MCESCRGKLTPTTSEGRRLQSRAGPLVIATLVLIATALPAAAQDGEHRMTTHVVESFDGTPLLAHLFLPAGASEDEPVPLVMRTHGWAGTGETAVAGLLEKLLDAGYAVLTWDQRGFGCSGGEAHVDKPDVEGRDASTLITWAADNAPIATDASGDPLVGFTGGSYAGGIQTATAAFDPRVDAIAPEIVWEDLRYSLYQNRVILFGWVEILYAAGVATATGQGLDPSCPTVQEHGPQTGGLAQEIHQGYVEGTTTNQISQDTVDWFGASSPAVYGEDNPVAVPTLVVNGSVDTLFDLTEGARLFDHVRAQGAPAKYIVFCGGHVGCPSSYEDADDREHIDAAILDWFARHLRGEDVDTGASVDYRTNEGVWREAAGFTPPDARNLAGAGEGTLVATPLPTAFDPETMAGQLQSGGAIPATPITAAQPSQAGDPHAMSVEVAAAEGGPLEIVGIPTATVSVTGSGPAAHLFLKLLDREADEILNLQEAPLRVEDLSDDPQTFEVTMPGLAYTLPDGHHLDLQVATTSLMHTTARTPAEVDVEVQVRVPTTTPRAAQVNPAPEPEPPVATTQGLPATGGGLAVAVTALLAAGTVGRRLRS